MKIDDHNLAGVSGARTGATQGVSGTGRGKSAGSAGAASNDEVRLSDLASALNALAPDSPERGARVERLAAEYRAGTYKVDSAALSRSMVDDALRTGPQSE